MAIDENTKEILRELGLNAYEVDAYVVLLDCGQMTAMEISREAKVPYSKIYEVLNSLKVKGWIKIRCGRPSPAGWDSTSAASSRLTGMSRGLLK